MTYFLFRLHCLDAGDQPTSPLVETFSALTTFLGSLLPLGFGDQDRTIRVPCNYHDDLVGCHEKLALEENGAKKTTNPTAS